jgi:magnesium chelatase family protein
MRRQGCVNALLDNRQLLEICDLDPGLEDMLAQVIDRLRLSARSYHKLLRLARSIADLEAANSIEAKHIAEAAACRRSEQKGV